MVERWRLRERHLPHDLRPHVQRRIRIFPRVVGKGRPQVPGRIRHVHASVLSRLARASAAYVTTATRREPVPTPYDRPWTRSDAPLMTGGRRATEKGFGPWMPHPATISPRLR